jgi:hypothetical protein
MNGIESQRPSPPIDRTAPLGQLRVWHLALLVLFVAIAIVNIQDQRPPKPELVTLAALGFVLYWFLGWAGWRFARRWESRLGPTLLLTLYLAAMAGLFLVATVVYVAVEIFATTGQWGW